MRNFDSPRASHLPADPRQTAVCSRSCQAAGGLYPLDASATSSTLLQPSWADRRRLELPSKRVSKLTPFTGDASSLGEVTITTSSLEDDPPRPEMTTTSLEALL
jgi:hypothetical protein